MINRRNIRVKVMQTLYAYTSDMDSAKPPDPHIVLKQHFRRTQSSFIYMAYFLTEVARYAEKDAFKKSHKYIPSEKDLNVNIKLAGSDLLWQIIEINRFKTAVKNEKPEQLLDETLLKNIYKQLTESQPYHHYINIHQQSIQEDRKIFEFILNDLMLGNDNFTAHIEEVFSNWEDDGDIIVPGLMTLLYKPQSVNFEEIITPDKERFANDLLKTVIDKDDYLLTLIKPKLKNWDPERIALLDMLIMKMGVAEFLYFDTIPPKVTINEYIDLAKEYSTAQSGHFVNGILDNIHKELLQEGKLKKIDFRKA